MKPGAIVFSASATNRYGHPNWNLAKQYKDYTEAAAHNLILWDGMNRKTAPAALNPYKTEAMYLTRYQQNDPHPFAGHRHVPARPRAQLRPVSMRRSTRLILALAVSSSRSSSADWSWSRDSRCARSSQEMPAIPLRLKCTIFSDSIDVPAFVFVPGIPILAFA